MLLHPLLHPLCLRHQGSSTVVRSQLLVRNFVLNVLHPLSVRERRVAEMVVLVVMLVLLWEGKRGMAAATEELEVCRKLPL